MRALWAGAVGAWKMVLTLVLLAIMLPLYLIGIVAGAMWVGLVAGFKAHDNFAAWLTGSARVWSITIEQPESEG